REQHPVGDPGRLLRTRIREESLDGSSGMTRPSFLAIATGHRRPCEGGAARVSAGSLPGSALPVSLGVVGLSRRGGRGGETGGGLPLSDGLRGRHFPIVNVSIIAADFTAWLVY